MKKVCIVVAGGKGKRIGAPIPKQFLLINGTPLLMLTLKNMYGFDESIDMFLVLPKDEIATWNDLCVRYNFTIPHTVIIGGKERFFSVKNALAQAPDESIIAIHDGVRPFISVEAWKACIDCAIKNGTAVPCIPVTSSLRKTTEAGKTQSVDRSLFLEVQTPQVFKSEIIKQAYAQEYSPLFTDDASVSECAGFPTFTTEGNPENIKITTPFDLKLAEVLSSKNETYAGE